MLLVIFYCIAVQLCFVVLFVISLEELNGWISMMGAWVGSLGGGEEADGGAGRVCWAMVWASCVTPCVCICRRKGGS